MSTFVKIGIYLSDCDYWSAETQLAGVSASASTVCTAVQADPDSFFDNLGRAKHDAESIRVRKKL